MMGARRRVMMDELTTATVRSRRSRTDTVLLRYDRQEVISRAKLIEWQ